MPDRYLAEDGSLYLQEAGISAYLLEGSSDGGGSGSGRYLQEGGDGFFLLEDGSGYYILEAAERTGPATIRQAVLYRLLQTTGLSAAYGTRITSQAIPQLSGLPAITISIPSGAAGQHLKGSDGTLTQTVQINCWSRKQGDVDVASDVVRRRFHGFQGWIGRVEVLSSLLDSPPYDLSEPPSKATDSWVYRSTSEYSIKYRVSIPDQLEE